MLPTSARKPEPALKKKMSEHSGTPDPQAIAGRVLYELGLPPGPAQSFITRTIQADLNAVGLDDVLNEE